MNNLKANRGYYRWANYMWMPARWRTSARLKRTILCCKGSDKIRLNYAKAEELEESLNVMAILGKTVGKFRLLAYKRHEKLFIAHVARVSLAILVLIDVKNHQNHCLNKHPPQRQDQTLWRCHYPIHNPEHPL
jgi:hypothetical protein